MTASSAASVPEPRQPQRPPRGLGAAGRRLWRSYVTEYKLRPDELQHLASACRSFDELIRIEDELAAAPSLTTAGSKGQPRPHPLLEEARRHRATILALLTPITLSDDDLDERRSLSKTRSARELALARWKRG